MPLTRYMTAVFALLLASGALAQPGDTPPGTFAPDGSVLAAPGPTLTPGHTPDQTAPYSLQTTPTGVSPPGGVMAPVPNPPPERRSRSGRPVRRVSRQTTHGSSAARSSASHRPAAYSPPVR